MNGLSINIQGVGNLDKRSWIRALCNKHIVNFLGIQETKMEVMDVFVARSLCGNPPFMYDWSPSRGQS